MDVGCLAGGEQQRLHFMRLGPELGRQAELGMFRADPQACSPMLRPCAG